LYVRQDLSMYVTWLVHVCDVTRLLVWHWWIDVGMGWLRFVGSISTTQWHTYGWVVSHIWVGHVTRVRMSHVIHMYQSCRTYERVMSHVPRSHVIWHDSCICTTWLIRACDMITHMCDMTHAYVWHECVMSHIPRMWLSQVTHINDSN